METKTYLLKRGTRTKVVRQKNGVRREYAIKGGWFFRIQYVESNGRPHIMEKGPFKLKAEARDRMTIELDKLRGSDGKSRDGDRMTFADLAEICLVHKDVYGEGSVRSRSSIEANIKNLKRFLRKILISRITGQTLHDYKTDRLTQTRKTKQGEPERTVKVATVHRELATLRHMIFFAIREGWVVKNPFFGSKVFSTSEEIKRDRVLTRQEETRLLAACFGTWTVPYERKTSGDTKQVTATFTLDNKHLHAMIILALDSGMRRGEILKLAWSDIDFETRRIKVRASNSKTGIERSVPLSDRSRSVLESIKKLNIDGRVFPFSDIKRSFATAKRLAGIEDLRFHDLRRTAISRWQTAGASLAYAGKAAGHSDLQTTMSHYTVIDEQQIDEIRRRIDDFNEPSTMFSTDMIS